MHATCTICGDIFTGTYPEVIHSTQCGHLFHYVCLLEWLQRSKTCPQCRGTVKENKTIKIFFSVNSTQSSLDTGSMENELQSLKFKITLLNLDVKKLTEEKDTAVEQAKELRNMIKKREEQIKTYETRIGDYQEKLNVYKFQIKSLKEEQTEKEELQKLLLKYSRIQKILNGSSAEATENLNQMKEKDANTLCSCITALKKEIEHFKETGKYLKKQLNETEKQLSSCTAEIDKLRSENSVLHRAIEKFKAPCNDKSDDGSAKNVHADNSIIFSSDDEGNENINKSKSLLNEQMDLTLEDENFIDLVSPPKQSLFSRPISPTSPLGLRQFKNARSKSLLTKARIPIKSTSAEESLCFDGFGGHAKEEVVRTDRATLLREIEHSKGSNKLHLPPKRLKPFYKNTTKVVDLRNFCVKKT